MSTYSDIHQDRKRLSALDTNYWRSTSSSGLPTPDDAAFYTPISAPVTPAEPSYYGSAHSVVRSAEISRVSPGSRPRQPSESRLSPPKAPSSGKPDYPSPTRAMPPLEKIPEIHTPEEYPAYEMPPPEISKAESRKSRRLSNFNPSPRSPIIQEPPRYSTFIPRPRAKILFYHKQDEHYGFTNFSSHPVIYQGKRYPTSEHLFQSFKFHGHRPGLAEHIRTCSERPSVAFSEARRFQPEVRPDWKHVNVAMMDITLEHKFTQHQDLKQELLSTGDAELVEDSDKDAFWGVGADGKGRNELGKALERLRDMLKARL